MNIELVLSWHGSTGSNDTMHNVNGDYPQAHPLGRPQTFTLPPGTMGRKIDVPEGLDH